MHHRRDALCAHLFSRAPPRASASGRLDKEIPVPRVLSRTRIPEERANNLIITKTCSCSLPAKYIFSCNVTRAFVLRSVRIVTRKIYKGIFSPMKTRHFRVIFLFLVDLKTRKSTENINLNGFRYF